MVTSKEREAVVDLRKFADQAFHLLSDLEQPVFAAATSKHQRLTSLLRSYYGRCGEWDKLNPKEPE